MNTEITVKDSDELIKTLQNSLYPDASRNSIEMVLSYCKAAKIDPMLKPLHIVRRKNFNKTTNQWEEKEVIMEGIGLHRIKAERSGEYMGLTKPEYGPMIKENIGGIEVVYPEWCCLAVKRLVNGQIVDYPVLEFWKENYAEAEKNGKPNAIWLKRPYGQLTKCAESQALRKAFPSLISAQPTFEEMEGKNFDIGLEDNKRIKVDMSTKILNKLNSNYITYDGIGKEVPMQSSSIPDGVMDAKDIWPNNKADSYEYLEWIYNYSEEIKGRVDGCLNFLKLTNITELPTEKASSLISKIEKEYPALKQEWDRHRKKIWE